MARTYVTVNVTRYEMLTYLLDDALDNETAVECIQDECPDPEWSKIRQEDIDVVELQVLEQPCKFCDEWKPAHHWHQHRPVCADCWDDRLKATE